MNILPKKSWHVRTKKNIEKVRRDEREAEKREEDRLERIAIAEREARTHQLRQRTRTTSSTVTAADPDKHFSIFDGVERGLGDIRKNKEREAEERKKAEDWEQKVGILTFLHRKDESESERLWYLRSHAERIECRSDEKAKNSNDSHDPLIGMKKYWQQMRMEPDKKRDDGLKRRSGSTCISGKKKTEREDRDVDKSGDKEDKMKRLREERLRREVKEREKSEKLVKRRDRNQTPHNTLFADDERNRRFNSQFHPTLARH